MKTGRVHVAAVDEAVRRVLRVKVALQLFERPYTEERGRTHSLPGHDVELARVAAEESIVLLKNGSAECPPALPLPSQMRTIAIIGPLADAPADMLGCWSARGDAANVITLRAAFAQYAADANLQLLYEKGCDITGGTDADLTSAVDAARRADVVLLALGEGADMSGEAASRTRLSLPGRQPDLLTAVEAAGRPIVLIVFSGRPLVLTPYMDKVAAVVQAWLPGIQGGPALVRLLTGAANFSGRLTMSMPRSVGQLPMYYNHLSTGRPIGATVDKYVSRYIDEPNDPLYPFGFGLSYTQFEYTKPLLSTSVMSAAAINNGTQKVIVKMQVRNVGSHEGSDIAQLYVRLRGTSVARPVRELKGFQRVLLRPGESRDLRFAIAKNELAFWNADLKWLAEPSAVTVWIARDANSGDGAELTITE